MYYKDIYFVSKIGKSDISYRKSSMIFFSYTKVINSYDFSHYRTFKHNCTEKYVYIYFLIKMSIIYLELSKLA